MADPATWHLADFSFVEGVQEKGQGQIEAAAMMASQRYGWVAGSAAALALFLLVQVRERERRRERKGEKCCREHSKSEADQEGAQRRKSREAG